MRIVIDLQGAQTESRFRGIGRYSLSLALAIAQNPENHEIWLVLNGVFVESILDIRQAFEGLIPQERIRVFDIPMYVAEGEPLNASKARVAEKIREYFIQELKPDVVLLTSLFEGYIDDAVTSISAFSTTKTAIILYDLIPLLNNSTYLPTIVEEQYYARKIQSLKNASLVLSISDYSRQEAIKALEIDPDNIVNISAGVAACFNSRNFSQQEMESIQQRYGISRKIILSVPGGGDSRKNIDGLVTAYSLLPQKLRSEYQLVVAGRYGEAGSRLIEKISKQVGLEKNELVITGYLQDEELQALYSKATLFVFPSKYEGFGLPILEAMICGVPVIGSNNTSIPEVIDYEKALFDANSPASIKDKIQQVLEDKNFRDALREHGFKQVQKFSWEKSAQIALRALEKMVIEPLAAIKTPLSNEIKSNHKPRLAFVSPLPPERTGIADYSVDLLPELLPYFEVELITDQPTLALPPTLAMLPRHSVNWFLEQGMQYDRIVYQLGNSPFHSHMLPLMRLHPGVVVLHDFFLSSLLAYEEMVGNVLGVWTEALYYSHGYQAVKKRFDSENVEVTKNIYPCNLEVLHNAKGMIVHSAYSQQLARHWYGEEIGVNWNVIPLVRKPALAVNRNAARKALNISEDAFVVCSFGMLAPTKLNHRLLNAWLASRLHLSNQCQLIFVGENEGGDYGAKLIDDIRRSGCGHRVEILGWVDQETYSRYLQAADISVQLRSMSRGEMSAALLDCMNYGLPTIVNAHGSAKTLPDNAVWMLEDEFKDSELTHALETLWENNETRQQLASQAREVIHYKHHPQTCALQYAQVINAAYHHSTGNQYALLESIMTLDELPKDDETLKYIAQSLANNCVLEPAKKQLLVDVSSIISNDLKSGIERVVRAQLLELINNPPAEFRIEPVYLTEEGGFCHYRYAKQFTFELLNIPFITSSDSAVDISAGDIFYALDFCPGDIMLASKSGLFLKYRALGVQINVLVYDLLPLSNPNFFPSGTDMTHRAWLEEIVGFADRLIAISVSVADELRRWLKQHDCPRSWPIKISSVPLGADIAASAPTGGLPIAGVELLDQLKKATCFLVVGTIEPRKGHLQIIAAFERLWQLGHEVMLIIVGKEGWKHLPDDQKRSIPTIVEKLHHHPERGKRLFWLSEVSDEYLQKIYSASTCLIAASEGEGFGLPLIEAAQYRLPIIARDLPVFREVAQDYAYYFSGLAPVDLADAIKSWLALHQNAKAPISALMPWQTWAQTTEILRSVLLGKLPERFWVPRGIRQKVLDEHLNLIHNARVTMVSTLLPPGEMILDLGGANCPLYKMGYPHSFEKLTLIDLQPDQRHDYYKDIKIDSDCTLGEVVIRYDDMTTLEGVQDQSVNFVWSGQSIEHVPQKHAERMCREAFRVLKSGGKFCLDTPNRRLTEIHTRSIGGGFIHPEHHIEYYAEQLIEMLKEAGFSIERSYGICEMPETLATGEFHYEDFMFGKQITDNVADGYIQFHYCVKP
jgi:glycosyltransferase involved in cell wall biosynthesis/predicted SAM-dependent methyltransferase